MTDKELMQQALEALENAVPEHEGIGWWKKHNHAKQALRERLAHCDRCGKKLGGPDHIHTCSPQVQEPVIDKSAAIRIATALGWEPRQWQGLTDEELEQVFPAIATYHEANKTLYRSIARAIETKLKEKNT